MNTFDHIITIDKARFWGYHGLLPHEKVVGNDFEVTLQLHFSANKVIATGDLTQGLNYAEVYQLLEKEMAQPTELLEVLTDRILTDIGLHFRLVTKATLSITKLAPPIAHFQGHGITFTASARYPDAPSSRDI